MKIFVVKNSWVGGWMENVIDGLLKNGHKVSQIVYERKDSFLHTIKAHNIVQVRNYLEEKSLAAFNRKVQDAVNKERPDLFLTMNESYLMPSTVKYIQKSRCQTACFIADNPFDSHRFIYLPISLKYFNKILVSDKIWLHNIGNVAPNSEIIKIPSGGGFNPQLFYPVKDNEISKDERKRFANDISFTGESYGMLAEGAYRAGILDQLGKYDVKIWGDDRWLKRFPYYTNISHSYQGERLSYESLRKLYRISTINLNMPSPQIFTGFQPRLFEIAACKGFQIVDWREELDELFSVDELVTFKNIPDLLEKVNYFINHPEKRKTYIDKLFEKVTRNYSWDQRVPEIIDLISN